jgi:hypothetical protein
MSITPIQKVKNLGGKLGIILTERLKLKTMKDISTLAQSELKNKFGEKTGTWLHQISNGIDLESVEARQMPKSIGCSKQFPGKGALNSDTKVNHWCQQLSDELEERLTKDKEQNKREATSLVIHITNEVGTFSKTTSLSNYKSSYIKQKAFELLKTFNKSKTNDNKWTPPLLVLGISASKFIDFDCNQSKENNDNIFKYFSNTNNNKSAPKTEEQEEEQEQEQEQEATLNKSIDNEIEYIELNTDSNSEPVSFDQQPTTSNFNNKSPIQISTEISVEATIQYEDIDYVRCEKCFKMILSWEMPEHEDLHFAKEMSIQLAKEENAQTILNRKRSLEKIEKEETAPKTSKTTILNTKRQKKTGPNPSTNNDQSKNNKITKIKSIENYFTKKN